MKYMIQGASLPVLKLEMNPGESVECEAGAMSWMDDGIVMDTNIGNGIGSMFGRMFTNENAFLNRYTAQKAGEIVFSSRFPGSISAVKLNGSGIVVQKGAFLADVGKVQNEVHFQKKLGGALFGGEGLLMRRYHGDGIVFLEIDGSAHEYELAQGQCKIIDTGYLAAMSDTCTMDVRTVDGAANVFFGGEGLFNTVVYGPGKVILQSMPIATTAVTLADYMPGHNTRHQSVSLPISI